MKKIIVLLVCFILPSIILVPLLRFLGFQIGKHTKIGFSIIYVNNLKLLDNTKIGHLNLILNNKLIFEKNAYLGYLNILKGPFDIILKEKAAIGNKNYITRARKGISYGESCLTLGRLTKVTVGHHLDLTKSITFGEYSILAGIKSQLWTHGYYHANTGSDRIRIDGEIKIGNNVYIGSACIFNPGVKVSDAIHIGTGCVISKHLEESGMYVSQGLRFIKNDINTIKEKLHKVEDNNLVEQVYYK